MHSALKAEFSFYFMVIIIVYFTVFVVLKVFEVRFLLSIEVKLIVINLFAK